MKNIFVFICFQLAIFSFCSAQDWANLGRYRDVNDTLKGKKIRAVFMGNSITDSWIRESPEFFAKNDFVDRGISGQTSPQMLLRFRQDVIALHPGAVVLLCGTNDIAGNTGPSTLEMIEDNIMSMAELAKANKIKPVLCSVLPVLKYYWNTAVEPVEKIAALNAWIKAYAAKNHFRYLDYYAALADDQKGMKKEYSEDGVHPNKAGYTVMEKIAEPVIRKL
jgi:lysophospholipase L1-like esterase